MKRAGCLQVSMGLESADPEMMERHKAGAPGGGPRRVKRIHEAGLRAKGLFIFGLPGETPETFQPHQRLHHGPAAGRDERDQVRPFYGAPMWHEIIQNEGMEGTSTRTGA